MCDNIKTEYSQLEVSRVCMLRLCSICHFIGQSPACFATSQVVIRPTKVFQSCIVSETHVQLSQITLHNAIPGLLRSCSSQTLGPGSSLKGPIRLESGSADLTVLAATPLYNDVCDSTNIRMHVTP